jgi:multiple sugar transport system ATP-binding protein
MAGLKVKKVPRPEIVRRVQHAAEVLDLGDLLERKPRALSGGQRQRVAMGRAIVREPGVFLMDEPLSNLDAQLRVHMRAEVGRLQRQLGTTTIYVTHDQVEAMTMGDRVALMRNGRLQQFATPQELYDRPINVFVGGFIGSPAMNLVDGTIQRSNGDITVLLGGQRLALDTSVLAQRRHLGDYQGRQVVVGIRPESIADAALAREPQENRLLQGTVELREELGPELFVHFSAPDVQLAETGTIAELPRDTSALRASSDSSAVLVGRFGPDSGRPGGRTRWRRGRHRASPLLRPRYRTRDLCHRQGRSDHVRVPVRAFASDADRMVAQERRLADASHVVTSEDVFSLAQALREAKRAHAVSLAELRQADADPVEDWAVWYAEYLLGVG